MALQVASDSDDVSDSDNDDIAPPAKAKEKHIKITTKMVANWSEKLKVRTKFSLQLAYLDSLLPLSLILAKSNILLINARYKFSRARIRCRPFTTPCWHSERQ